MPAQNSRTCWRRGWHGVRGPLGASEETVASSSGMSVRRVKRTSVVSACTSRWAGGGPSFDAPDFWSVESAASANARTYPITSALL